MSLRQQDILCKEEAYPQPQRLKKGTECLSSQWGSLQSSAEKGNDSSSSLGSVAATPLLTLGYLLPCVGKSVAGLGRQRFACVG